MSKRDKLNEVLAVLTQLIASVHATEPRKRRTVGRRRKPGRPRKVGRPRKTKA